MRPNVDVMRNARRKRDGAHMVEKGEGTDHAPARDGQHAPHLESAERSEEHTSELQSLMRISYAVLCLKKKTKPSSDLIDYNTRPRHKTQTHQRQRHHKYN